MNFEVRLIPSARRDFGKLDRRRQILVAKQLVKLETNPFAGNHLGPEAGIDLTGYYKLHADKKRIRMVYTVIEEEIRVKGISIGQREDMVAYREAARRIV